MNAKTAKLLRRITGYRNSTATPSGAPEFPGVARFYQHPVYTQGKRFRFVVGRGYVAIDSQLVLEMVYEVTDPDTLESNWYAASAHVPPELVVVRPKTSLVPVTKPIHVRRDTPRGKYRFLKRAVELVGLDRTLETLRLAAEAEAASATPERPE